MTAGCKGAPPWQPGRLVSLWDMLRIYAAKYIQLGMEMHDAGGHLYVRDADIKDGDVRPLSADAKRQLGDTIRSMGKLCGDLRLFIAQSLCGSVETDVPQTMREYEMLIRVVNSELAQQLFLHVHADRAKYYESDELLTEAARLAFPGATVELRASGSCYACDQYTASVFHAMRAAELGLRSLAKAVDVILPYPIELADWNTIIEKIEKKIVDMKLLPKGAQKDDDLKFYSDCAVHFRYFKDAWRIRVSHARESYTEAQATTILRHSQEFTESLALRLTE